jgi:hypothetical protein
MVATVTEVLHRLRKTLATFVSRIRYEQARARKSARLVRAACLRPALRTVPLSS